MIEKLKILFLCTGNSCRSQMAEGWTRYIHGDLYDVYSAGLTTHGINQNAAKVMMDVGVDISKQTSNNIDEYLNIKFDYVITVCGHADEYCPVFPGNTIKFHKGFPDPPKLTENIGNSDEKLKVFRKVRDEIQLYIRDLPHIINLKS